MRNMYEKLPQGKEVNFLSEFKVVSEYTPKGDQPKAIEQLSQGIISGNKAQTLLGVTGSGKTFTIANTIAKVNKPTLVLAHNKTLAAQLCSEFKEFFPNSAVEFFVSYYDYYQPEAYIPQTDTYIEKDAQINDEIDKLRHSATSALFERRDVIVVSSVSCIYSLGDPADYAKLILSLRTGMQKDRDEIILKLIEIQYERNDINFVRGKFRVRGDVLEIFPASSDSKAIRVEFFGDEIERITEIDVLTGEILGVRNHVAIYPFIDFTFTESPVAAMSKKEKRKLLDAITQYCLDKGYSRSSIWTFSSEQNANYSSMTRENFLGFGCSATSLFKKQFKINTFDVESYCERIRSGSLATSLTIRFTKRQRMVYWLFWTAYSTKVDPDDFQRFFGVPLKKMYGFELWAAKQLGLIKEHDGIYEMTLKGAFYYHYYENFYTLAYIDKTWGIMRKEAFPEQIVL